MDRILHYYIPPSCERDRWGYEFHWPFRFVSLFAILPARASVRCITQGGEQEGCAAANPRLYMAPAVLKPSFPVFSAHEETCKAGTGCNADQQYAETWVWLHHQARFSILRLPDRPGTGCVPLTDFFNPRFICGSRKISKYICRMKLYYIKIQIATSLFPGPVSADHVKRHYADDVWLRNHSSGLHWNRPRNLL